jgi:hypothetical protein
MGKITALNIAILLSVAGKGFQAGGQLGLVAVPQKGSGFKLVLGETAVAWLLKRGGLVWGEDLRRAVFGADMALSSRYFNFYLLSVWWRGMVMKSR